MKLRAALVSVDYADLLGVTLPYNRHHFDEVLVVTTPDDWETHAICGQHDVVVYVTSSFYDEGAVFNKWKAFEEGLDRFGREGWMCLMDADVLWPRDAAFHVGELEIGNLYGPLRRMWYEPTPEIPPEEKWGQLPMHPQQSEWAGFTQIFHAGDPRLGEPPWHETTWRHAGGGDSFFQLKWPKENKHRLDWQVLHLGQAGHNWCGRATDYIDGTENPHLQKRYSQTRQFIRGRNQSKKQTGDPYAFEKLDHLTTEQMNESSNSRD